MSYPSDTQAGCPAHTEELKVTDRIGPWEERIWAEVDLGAWGGGEGHLRGTLCLRGSPWVKKIGDLRPHQSSVGVVALKTSLEPGRCSIRRLEISLRAWEKPVPGMSGRASRSFPCGPLRGVLRNGKHRAVRPEEGSQPRTGCPKCSTWLISRFGKLDVLESVSWGTSCRPRPGKKSISTSYTNKIGW